MILFLRVKQLKSKKILAKGEKAMSERILSDRDLDILLREARTYNGWQDKDVTDVLVQAVYDLAKFGPTSMNCCPARFLFVKSPQGK